MENKTILKQFNQNLNEFMGKPSIEDFELIKPFISSDTLPDDLFVYKLKLCDNEVDRDFEQFNSTCIKDISSLFYGKVGVYNHDWKSEGVHSRIYKALPVLVEGVYNSLGEPYEYVEAYAYTSKENISLINEIKRGLKREVSIGILGTPMVCSVCGNSHCEHIKGKVYNNKLCFGIIPHAEDAFEFSFVAVNAQKDAGVKKNYLIKGGIGMQEIKAAILKLAENNPKEGNLLIKAFEDLSKTEDEKINALRVENEELKAKLKEFEEEKAKREHEERMATILDGLCYKTNKAEEIGGEIIAKNEDLEADALHNMLITDYSFLFESVPNAEEVIEDIIEDVEEVKENVEEVENEEVKENIEGVEEIEKEEVKENIEEVKENVEEIENEEVKEEDENKELKEVVQKKLKAFKASRLNIEALQYKEPNIQKRKIQSGLRFN